MRPFRRRAGGDPSAEDSAGAPILVIGLGNPGTRYAGTRHNAGFDVAAALSTRWDLPRARKKYGGLIAEGRTRPGGPRVSILLPQTFMNESGEAAAPARGELGIGPERIVALHDEIDLPFGEIRTKLGGGVAGHNGLKSLERGLGGRGFWRVRIGVGRPDSTDPEIVSRWVLGRFSEGDDEVRGLIDAAAEEADRLIERIDSGESDEPAEGTGGR